jgi:uncharacterized damage-inducible protein DinB
MAGGSAMSPRANQYVTQFKAVNDEIIATVAGCADDQWQRPSAEEGWSIAAIAHHVAVTDGLVAGVISSQAAGNTDLPTMSAAEIDAMNAMHAREYASVGKQETLDLLRANGDVVVQTLQRIDDDEFFDQPAGAFGGYELNVGQILDYVVIGHAAGHTASIRATLAG